MFTRSLICVLLLLFGVTLAFCQSNENRDPNKRPRDFLTPALTAPYMKTSEYRKAHEQLERYFWWVLESKQKDEVLSQTKEAVLRTIITEKNFWKIANDRYWCAKNAP